MSAYKRHPFETLVEVLPDAKASADDAELFMLYERIVSLRTPAHRRRLWEVHGRARIMEALRKFHRKDGD